MNIQKLREHIKDFQFRELFIDDLGWYHTNYQAGCVNINNNSVSYSYIAEINAVPVLQLKVSFYSDSDRKKLHREIEKQHKKHLLLFHNDANSFTLSYLSKEGQVRTHSYFKEQNADDLVGKLSSIHFGIEEDEPKITEIGEKLDQAFNTEKVTKKFYKDFKNNHFNFQKYISGIPSEEDKKWYASVILNRLMFIWFLQKKLFVNDDALYLKTKLEESQQRKKDKYYREFLTLLFFEGFAKRPKERSEKAKQMLGEIDYLNGGLFVPHSIEEKYGDRIQIKDKAFEETYKIFQEYEWHIQDEKGKDNEISPDVLGYIFEKYINELQQKSLGAYYTRDEITNYLSRNTIDKCILDKVNATGYQFRTIEEMLHKLDAQLCKKLLTDEDSILNTLTILDPAVGSGAFLISAMKRLMNIYSPIIGKIKMLSHRDLKSWLEDFEGSHKSIAYGIKKNIILKNLYGVDIMKEATEVCKLRLFLSLVASALDRKELEPLPNIDFNIMCGNSLIGFLKEDNKQEQLSLDGHSYTQIKSKYNQMVNKYKTQSLSFDKLKELKKKINDFLEEESLKLNSVLADRCGKKGLKYSEVIDIQGKNKSTKKRAVSSSDFENLQPFHWDFAFNEIIDQGGFDVIITNPPWEKVKNEDKEFFSKYDSSLINKKRCKKSELNRKKEHLLTEPNIKKEYLKIEEYYLFQRDYFSKFYSSQSSQVIDVNKKKKNTSSDIESYRLFTERYFSLLGEKGFLGAVLPRGFYCDEGAIGLRKYIFNHKKIEGIITFVNQGKGKPIFDGVGSTVQFLLLNLRNNKPQDKFPCLFQQRDLKVLENFPENVTRKQSVKEIKELSPRDCVIIEFKNPKDRNIFKKAQKFSQLAEKLQDSWNSVFYTEFHETNDTEFFKSHKNSKEDLPLYVGKAINPFQFNYNLSPINRYVSIKSKKVQGNGLPFKNKCYKNYRLVIRKMASTGARKLISSVIPKNNFIAYSLNGVYFELNNFQRLQSQKLYQVDNSYMLLLQAFLNSFLIDYFIKQKIYFNIALKDLYELRIPRLTEKDPYFKILVKKSAQLTCIGKEFDELADEIGIAKGGVTDQEERWKIQGEIDAIVATIYGLTLEEFEYVLSTFATGRNQERLQALKKYALEAFKKNNFSEKAA